MLKGNELSSHEKTWRILLGEGSQSEKAIYCMIPYGMDSICNVWIPYGIPYNFIGHSVRGKTVEIIKIGG